MPDRFPRRRWLVALASLVGFAAMSAAGAAEPRRFSPDDLPRIVRITDPQIAPDGAAVAIVVAMLTATMAPQGLIAIAALLTGSHTIRVWYADPQHFRVAVPQSMSESDLIRNGSNAWLWESTDNTVTHLAVPTQAKAGHAKKLIHEPSSAPPMTPQQAAEKRIERVTTREAVA